MHAIREDVTTKEAKTLQRYVGAESICYQYSIFNDKLIKGELKSLHFLFVAMKFATTGLTSESKLHKLISNFSSFNSIYIMCIRRGMVKVCRAYTSSTYFAMCAS